MVFPYSFYCSFKETQKTCVWFYNLYALNFLSFSELWFFILFLLPPPPTSPILHGMHLLPKWTTFQFCFKSFSISPHVSGDPWDGSQPQTSVTAVKHQPSFKPSSAELPTSSTSVLPIGTACLALTQSSLTLAAEDGEGTQADFQLFRELGAACSQQPCSTVLQASEVPSIVDWGSEPRKCISRERWGK